MFRVECHGIQKAFGGTKVLRNVHWELPRASTWSLVGDSGAGKTTLLRIIAGLEQPDAGTVSCPNDVSVQSSVQPVAGMVFQDLGLWPHLTARQHLECVLPGALKDRRTEAERQLAAVELPLATWGQLPSVLSGGESQRLAIARALAINPQILLLDEPFSQLEMTLRTRLVTWLQHVQRERGITVILVTHSWMDPTNLCDNFAVLSDGVIAQAGSVEELLECPSTSAVARLTGPCVEIPLRFLHAGKVERVVELSSRWRAVETSDQKWLLVRPHQIHCTVARGADAWRVRRCMPHAAGWKLWLESGPDSLELVSTTSVETEQTVRITTAVAITRGRDRTSRPGSFASRGHPTESV